MKVYIEKKWQSSGCQILFNFELDTDDVTNSRSNNAGKNEIQLVNTRASFDIPFDIALPHPDLLALAAIKIVSPYIGSRLELNYPVSHYFACIAKEIYPNIKYINEGNIEHRYQPSQEKYAVSFSGGADSLAAANICPPGTPLILLARKYHKDIGKFEPWYRTDGNIETLFHMNDAFVKIPILSDFEFLSVNKTNNYCVYPDNYSFTIPCLLLSDHLMLSGILTGDMLAAFSGDERTKFSTERFKKQQKLYYSVGLHLDSAIKGVTELGSELINRYYKNSDIANTCQYGGFKQPCMKCIKCFRKSLIKAYLDGTHLTESQLFKFDKSNAIISLSKRESIPVPLTLKLITSNYDFDEYPNLRTIQEKLTSYRVNNNLIKATFDPYENQILPKTIQYCLNNIRHIFAQNGLFSLKELGL